MSKIIPFGEVVYGNLPFLNERVISKINQDFENVDALWQDCVIKANDYFIDDFSALQTKIKVGETLFFDTFGGAINEEVASDGMLHGYKIKITKRGFYTINLYNFNADFDSYILVQNGIQTQHTINNCNEIRISIDGYNCDDFFIGFLNDQGYFNRKSCDNSCMCNVICIDGVTVTSEKFNGDKIDTPFLFSLDIKSKIEPYLYSNASNYKMPVLFRAGMYLWSYAKTSTRVNAEELMFLEDNIFAYYENEYKKYLSSAVAQFDPIVLGIRDIKSNIKYIPLVP